MLQTKIPAASGSSAFGGKYHREPSKRTSASSIEYYQAKDSSRSRSRRSRAPGTSLGAIQVTFVISEGAGTVRKITSRGTRSSRPTKLPKGLSCTRASRCSRRSARTRTRRRSSQVQRARLHRHADPARTAYTDEPGVVDLVYRIEEGEPYLLGELKIVGNDRTKDKVIRREAAMAGLLPGEMLDGNRLETSRSGSVEPQYFMTTTRQAGQADRDQDRPTRPHDKPYGDLRCPTSTARS